MGIVVSTTPGRHAQSLTPIPRQKRNAAKEVVKGEEILIIEYDPPEETGLSAVTLKPIVQLNTTNVLPSDLFFDDLWHASYFLPNPRPSGSGYMSDVSAAHDHPDKAAISMLPIIDLNPNNMNCSYSTLRFIKSQVRYLEITTPVVTFDQSLWMKATEIIKAKSVGIACILGGFHLLMSFLGSLMKRIGLEEAFRVVLTENTVPYMLTRKAISRAVKDHFLVQSALVTNFFKPFRDDGEDEAEGTEGDISVEKREKTVETVKREDVLRELENVTKYIKDEGKTTEDIESKDYPVLFQLDNIVENYKEYLIKSSRTAKLWLLYIYCVDVFKMFIRAERSGYWNLHVVAIS